MTPKTHTLAEIARLLNRPVVLLSGLQSRFELPRSESGVYPTSHLALLRTLIYLRTFGIGEDRILRLWNLEKKLLQLLHIDTTGSTTWCIDSCGATNHPKRRLLLTNFDIGISIPSGTVQLGLDFSNQLPELFSRSEMGEDAIRILKEYASLASEILNDVAAEQANLRAAIKWAAHLAQTAG